jgi:LexA-binding, inner membrane-associated putative hydrolase
MTQVGHALTGTAIAVICLPKQTSWRHKLIHFVAFIALALVPDFPLPNWGHDKYYISHSLFMNLLFIFGLVILLGLFKNIRSKIGGWVVSVCGAAAWLSHLLLDSFYNHGKGVVIFWPFSKGRLILPIPWLSVVKTLPPPITTELVRILLIEFVTFFPLVLFAILIRTRLLSAKYGRRR